MARECGQAWGQSCSTAPSPVPDPVSALSPAPDPVPTSPVVPSSPGLSCFLSAAPDKSSLPDLPDKYSNMDLFNFKKAVEKQLSRYRNLNDRSLAQIVQRLLMNSVSLAEGGKGGVTIPLHAQILTKFTRHVQFKQNFTNHEIQHK